MRSVASNPSSPAKILFCNGLRHLRVACHDVSAILAQLPQLGVEIVAKSLILNPRLALHFAQTTREFQSIGKSQAQTVQQDRLGAVGTDYAAKAERAIVRGRGYDVGALDARELFQQRRWAAAEARAR